jgi:hypothetical protein
MEEFFEGRGKPQFFLKPADGGLPGIFARPGVAATGIGPKTGAMILFRRPLLQKHFPPGIKDKNTKGPVQDCLAMCLHFFHRSQGLIGFVDQDHFFRLLHNRLLHKGKSH